MKLRKFLVVSKSGSAKITANKPKLATNEIAIQLNIDIPDQLFVKPTLVADIKVDDRLASQELISAEVIDNAKQLLSEALGLELRVSVVEEEVKEII